MKITVALHTVLYNGRVEPAFARVYCNEQFVNSDDQTVFAAKPNTPNYVKQVAVSYAAGVATIGAFSGLNEIDSTVDTNGGTISTYALSLHGPAGNLLVILYPSLRIPFDPTTTTWDDIVLFNQATKQPQRHEYYDTLQIDRLLSDIVDGALVASEVQIGVAKLSLPAADLDGPIVVGDNDTRVPKDLSLYSNDLEEAIDEIGATETVLQITAPTTVAENLTVPRNIVLEVVGEGLITVSNPFTLTIGKMKNPGSHQIFAGEGTVLFSKGAVERMDVTWWAGSVDEIEISGYINAALLSAEANGGGRVYIPSGKWATIGGHVIPTGTTIEGDGAYNGETSVAGNTLLYLEAVGTPMFIIGDDSTNFVIQDIKCDGSSFSNTQGILCTGTYPLSSGSLRVERSVFNYFTDAFEIRSLAAVSQWQMALVSFVNCSFSGNINSAVKCNTVNTGLKFDTCIFGVPDDGVVFDIENCGTFTAISCEFAGLAGQEACSGGIPGPGMAEAIVRVTGQHLPMNFIGCQDEGFRYFIYNDFQDLYSSFNLNGCLIQSIIFLNEACVVNSTNNNYRSLAIKDAVGTASYIVSINDYIQATDLCGNVVSPPELTEFAGDSIVSFETTPILDRTVFRQPTKILSPKLYDGNPLSPLLRLLHYTGVNEDKVLLRLGRMSVDEFDEFYYDVYRDYSSGRLTFSGNQALPDRGYDFNAEVRAHQFSMSLVTSLASSGAVTMDCSLSNRFNMTPTGDATINAANIVAGKKFYLAILTSGAVSWNVTFGTGFRSTGVLATGAVTDKYFYVEFYAPVNGTLIETGRTVAL